MKKILMIFILAVFTLPFNVSAKQQGYTLTWDAVTTNDDGTPCTDLAGYKIYIGTTSGSYGIPIIAANPLSTTYLGVLNVPDDALTTYYFVVTAYDTSDLESGFSNEVSLAFDTRVAPAPPQHLNWFERLVAWIKSWRIWG